MISVIIPIYNVENYLEECLKSVQTQTYTNIEVILVNDGSIDKSKLICERYCKEDCRFQLLNQENQGLSAARNNGVAASTGEFIAFVDSDDIILPNYLETLIHYMTDEIDIVESRFTVSKEEFLDERFKELTILFEGNSEEAVKIFPKHVLNVNAVAKLYRRQLVISFPFLEGLFYEDVYGGIGILKHINKMVKINYTGYYYRVRSGSIMNREFNTKNLDLFTICDKVEKLYNDDKKELSYVYRRLFNLVLMHVIDYKIFEGNPYKEKYSNYLNRYAKKSKKSLLIYAYLLFPKHIVTISRIVGGLQWRWEKYVVKRYRKG
ncbi:glycosyltransferase family 2 protein [uncultured Gemella sp.]|uniref:glycosyltransferase family 2 protein n=1 Tax=uncultured Gemella sp. TaxID=254352 RepID=UPI0025CCB7BB|nr:glycosyltransferase family 2 protein [uncultured Gemella sp.]